MIGRQRGLEGIDPGTAVLLADAAIGSLAESQSSWRPTELVRELAAVTPTTVTVNSEQLTEFLQRLADHAASTRCMDISRPAPAGMPLRRDGRPITEAAVDRALTTESILAEEEQLIAWSDRRQAAVSPHTRLLTIDSNGGLNPGQVEAAAAATSARGLELIVGPAGTGKTTTLATAVAHLHMEGRSVFGVAPTAAAAEVLATETGMPADTLDKLLTEHHHLHRPAEPSYSLPPGTTIIVDEAATAATTKLADLARLADQHDWRVVLVGDPRQFSAVGRGGMFAHLIETHAAVELDQVHRFRHQWERRASLRLRAGDPTVLTEYERRGRLHGGTLGHMHADIIAAWQQARHRGETVALMVNSTETVARLNQLVQHSRLQAGELHAKSPGLRVGEQRLLVGDEVVTRRNDRSLRTDQGLMVKNRDHWTITQIHPDASVSLTGRTGTICLPAGYIAQHLELGYAQTSHVTQGRTVDTSLLLIDTPTDSRGIYTPMTRGREANHAYVAVEDNQTARDVLTHAITRDWIDQPAVARQAQLDPHDTRRLTPTGPAEDDEFNQLEQCVRGLIAQRQARSRETERTTGRSL